MKRKSTSTITNTFFSVLLSRDREKFSPRNEKTWRN